MTVYINNIATAVPDSSLDQSYLREQMKAYIEGGRATQRIIHSIYSRSGIKKRHSVVADLNKSDQPRLFFKKNGVLDMPSTKQRNELYTQHAKRLFAEVAHRLMKESTQFETEDITHVITVSCTGFFAPGPSYHIVRALGLSSATERFHLGFMGCYAAFPALKMARSFCQANPNAVVMIVCVELCSLHLQASAETDQLISASVFADGASGTLVSSRSPAKRKRAFRLEQFQTSIADQSEKDMAWTIGDTGFEMVLSTYVPDIIKANLAETIAPLLSAYKINHSDIDHWAIHPGGRAILDKIEENMGLDIKQLAPSRTVLANYGNMSSATILFVLKELQARQHTANEERTLAMAFGPGLTIETALITRLGVD